MSLAVTDTLFSLMRMLHGGFLQLKEESAEEFRLRFFADLIFRALFPLGHLAVYFLSSDSTREADSDLELDRDVILHAFIVVTNNAFDIFFRLNYLYILSFQCFSKETTAAPSSLSEVPPGPQELSCHPLN